MYRTIFVILLFNLGLLQTAIGQCCSAGNPSAFAFSDHNSVRAKSLLIGASYKYGYSGVYFAGNKPQNVSFGYPASYSFLLLKTAYGISKRINIQLSGGYFLTKKQENPEPYPDDVGQGLADAEINVRYRFFKSMKRKTEFLLSGGLRLPIGVFDLEKNGVKLPITIQPSSGSLVLMTGISAIKSFENSKFRLYGLLNAEFPQLIDSRNFYYRYGNLVNLSLTTTYAVNRFFNTAIQVHAEFRGHATRENDQVISASGYHTVMVSPQLQIDYAQGWSFSVSAEFPVYRYFNGIQLANSFKTGFGLIKKIAPYSKR